MKNTTALVLGCLSLLLLLYPLAAPTRGLPVTLKADEPAYYLAALSLVRDGDLVCGTEDTRRLFDAFPHLPVENLILMSVDGWNTVYFGKPIIYPVLASPFAAFFEARGMVFFNMILFVAMIWMGFFYLRGLAPEALAAFFSVSFFMVSLAFVYVFWMHPEVLGMFSIMACLYFAWTRDSPDSPSVLARVFAEPSRAAWSGAALSLAVYNKPMLAAIGVPALYLVFRRRGLKGASVWLVAAGLALGGQALVSQTLTDTPTPYLGTSRAGFKIDDPERLEEMLRPFQQPVVTGENHSSYGWLARVPELFPRMLVENVGYFLVGRHTGLFVYLPFALVCLLLFLFHDRRDPSRWLVIGALAGVALFFMIWMHYNWHGGAGFVGNRYFVNLYPAFLFLVPALRPPAITALGFAGGGLFLAPLLFAPFGVSVPDPTLQWHVRGAAFGWLPQELSISAEVPGYVNLNTRGLNIRGRRDQFRISDRGSSAFWLRGASRAEVWISSAREIEEIALEVNSPAENRIAIAMGGSKETLSFSASDAPSQRVSFAPAKASKVRSQWGRRLYAYRLVIETETGRNRRRPDGEVVEPQFYVGAEIAVRRVKRAGA
ncbi:MAG: hypothetical protein ACE5GX_06700 [Thermoanaerobaculia bacterium]